MKLIKKVNNLDAVWSTRKIPVTLIRIKQQFPRLFLSYVLIEVNAANWKTKYSLRFIISVIAFQVLIKSQTKKNISEVDKN